MDIFSIHYLEPDTAKEDMAWLRARLAEVGFSGPIWNSEESVQSTSFLDQCRVDYAELDARYHYRNACYELVRKYMENIANGVSRVFYYDLADPWRFKSFDKPRVEQESQMTGSLWDEGQTFKPVGAAYPALALAIDGKPFVERIEKGPLQAFVFGDDKSATAVYYVLFPDYQLYQTSDYLVLPAGTIMDFMGNVTAQSDSQMLRSLPLSRAPVYLTFRGPRAAASLAHLFRRVIGVD